MHNLGMEAEVSGEAGPVQTPTADGAQPPRLLDRLAAPAVLAGVTTAVPGQIPGLHRQPALPAPLGPLVDGAVGGEAARLFRLGGDGAGDPGAHELPQARHDGGHEFRPIDVRCQPLQVPHR